MSSKGKIAVVTGGSRGIGKAIVRELAARGARVVFTYLQNAAEAHKLEEQVAEAGGEALSRKLDIGNFEDAKLFIQDVIREFDTIDILVNNAGVTRDCTLLKMGLQDWEQVINTNLNGVFNLTRQCIFTMLKNRSGRIINLSSTSGIQGLPGQTNYSASKAGIIGFSKALAKEVAAFGITVNVVAPAGVETEMLDSLTAKAREHLLSLVPCGRFCQPEEVANVVGYLATESPLYLSSNVIVLDGGAGIG